MVCRKNGFVLLLACIVIFQSPTGLASPTRSDESPADEERKTSSSARYERMESKANELATAWIGTATASGRTAVVMSAVQVKPGRSRSGIAPSRTTTTLKFVA